MKKHVFLPLFLLAVSPVANALNIDAKTCEQVVCRDARKQVRELRDQRIILARQQTPFDDAEETRKAFDNLEKEISIQKKMVEQCTAEGL